MNSQFDVAWSKGFEILLTAFLALYIKVKKRLLGDDTDQGYMLTLLHSGRPKLYAILAFLGAIGLSYRVRDKPSQRTHEVKMMLYLTQYYFILAPNAHGDVG